MDKRFGIKNGMAQGHETNDEDTDIASPNITPHENRPCVPEYANTYVP